MDTRNSWLFPSMVIAAGCVVAFGCVGIAAITGYVPLSGSASGPFGQYTAPIAPPETVPAAPVAFPAPPPEIGEPISEAKPVKAVLDGGVTPTLASKSTGTDSVVK